MSRLAHLIKSFETNEFVKDQDLDENSNMTHSGSESEEKQTEIVTAVVQEEVIQEEKIIPAVQIEEFPPKGPTRNVIEVDPSQRLSRVATIERSVSGSFKKFNIDPTLKQSNQRLFVLQEIITSEQDYVKDLAYIVQVRN